ncbi:MAG: T9SS type A sorting domain-containing protein, partial [Gemmatimonadota bacterium]
ADLNPNYRADAQALYERHLEAGVPRWDRPGTIDNWNSGAGMETWAQKTLDNHLASTGGLHIVEGIYGRDGHFMDGPHDGVAQDFMTNLVLFGLNPFKVDLVGFWLGGHEPGNVGLFHSALDRGFTDLVNPHGVPLYAWNGGAPERVSLADQERTPLLTYYLQRDYNGQTEPRWHMVDEPYDYGPLTAVTEEAGTRPQAFVLGQNYPNPFNPTTTIQLALPRDSQVRLEVYNSYGQVVDVLVDGWRPAGAHALSWNAGQRASGTYFYRLTTPGFEETRRMVLVR